MTKAIKYISLILGSLLVLMAVVVLSVAYFPRYFITDGNARRAAAYLERFGYRVTWDSSNISSEAVGFLDHRIALKFSGLCVESDAELKKACAKDLSAGFRYKIKWLVPSLIEAGPVDISGATLDYAVRSDEAEKKIKGEIELPKLRLPGLLKGAVLDKVHIDVERFSVSFDGDEISGSAVADATTDGAGKFSDVDLKTAMRFQKSGMAIDASASVSSESGFFDDPAKATLKGTISASAARYDMSGTLERRSLKELFYDLKLKMSSGRFSTDLALNGRLDSRNIETTISGVFSGISADVDRISVSGCPVRLRSIDVGGNDGSFSLNCPVTVRLKKIILPKEIDPIYQFPNELSVGVNAALTSFFLPELSHRTQGDIKLAISPVRSRLVDSSGNVDLRVDGTLADLPKSLSVSTKLDVDLKVLDFEPIVTLLKDTEYAVPAPFNILHGPLVIGLEGDIPAFSDWSRFPVTITSDLETEGEKIHLDAKGEAGLKITQGRLRRVDIDGEVSLRDVLLPLPTIQLAGLPRFAPDSRISLKEGAKKDVGSGEKVLNVKAKLSTPPSSPLQVVTNLAKKPVPVSIDLNIDDGKSVGTISIGEVPLNLFRRNAEMKGFKLNLADPYRFSDMSGEMTVNATDYLIRIKMSGSVERPNIWFESEPPLSEDNIVSVLIYGDTFDDLDVDKAASISNMQAAIANKAIALTTFFLFASTPIQSMAYNPETGAFTAKIKLGEKTSLTLGKTDSHTQNIGLRRRLGKGWFINTSVNRDEELMQTSGSAYIEWHKRY